jgi:hypothetical protein
MKVTRNEDRFDELQNAFLREVVRSIRIGLGEAGVDPEAAFQITEGMTFRIAALIDGAAPIDLDGDLVEPVLCFRETEDTLLTGHSSLHEMAGQTALEVCGEIDDEENDA